MSKNEKSERLPTMEMNKLSVGVITALVTLIITFGGFFYKEGQTTEQIKNLNSSIVKVESDLKEKIREVEEDKAEKDVVELILKKIDEINRVNSEDHRILLEKIDGLYNIGKK